MEARDRLRSLPRDEIIPKPEQQMSKEDSLDLIYDIAIKSYEVLERRYQSMDSRIQMVLSFAIGLVVVVLTLIKTTLEHPDFSSKLFLASMGAYALAVASALIGAFRWPVLTLRPKILYDKFRQLPETEFKTKLVYVAGVDAETMINTIAKKRYAAFTAIVLFIAASALLVVWALRASIPVR
jgi:hypothetical protein